MVTDAYEQGARVKAGVRARAGTTSDRDALVKEEADTTSLERAINARSAISRGPVHLFN